MSNRFPCWNDNYTLSSSEFAPGGIVIYYADGDEELIHVNQYVIDLFECDNVEEFLELVDGSFRGFVHGEDINSAEDSIWGQVEKHDNLDHINYRIQTKSGKLVNIEDFGRLVEHEGSRPVFHVFIIEAEQRGAVDWLTGLPSMIRFYELAEMGAETIRGRGDVPVAVALDLVGLKSFNTQNGREAGDKLLIAFADVIRKHFGSEACSRFGEDHFYAFSTIDGFDEKMADLFADFELANGGKTLPIRAGSYACGEHDDIIEVGFDRAKIACDLDRKTWQSHNMWFSEEMRHKEHLRIHVLDHLDRAVREGWIRPYYQALVRATTSEACGEEALARWIDPEYGALSPAQFIPVLEEAGLLHKVDMHMIDCVLADFETKWERGVPVVPVSVNISLRDLGKVDIVREITRKCDALDIPHDLLRIEFTESSATDDPGFFKDQVKGLQDAGFEVWMDDFGSGYSSLNMLQEHAFDLIKLDMRFISNIDDEKSRDIVAGVIQVAKKLGISTLAEGVETRPQAVFLESIGCDILQGFFYTHPVPLEEVIGRLERGVGMVREKHKEAPYWDAISAVDLSDPISNVDGWAVDGSPVSEFPAGVMEYRDGVWRLLRANNSYRDFLDQGGILPRNRPHLQANVTERRIDDEFFRATQKSLSTGTWERIAGRLEYGTGMQFYARPVAALPEAKAFLLAAVPTMLGTALGSYGDVPVAYAVFRIILDDSGKAADAEYVYANSMFCEWTNSSNDLLAGRSYLETMKNPSAQWIPYAYRAAVLKEDVHDTMYSPELGHWINVALSPSTVENCFVFAFTIADEEHRERVEIVTQRDTSALIVRSAGIFNKAQNYEEGMNAMLEEISRAIRPKRLSIFERGNGTDWITFEWCADEKDRQIDRKTQTSESALVEWDKLSNDGPVIDIPDVSVLKDKDRGLYEKLAAEGVTRMISAPLRAENTLIGYFVVENYALDEGIDIVRLLETMAAFVSARIINQRLMAELERAGTHDVLTGLLNRRGFDATIEKRLEEAPDAPYTLALMDIDNFKIANDLHGHDMGDAALKALADAVIQVFPDTAIIGRNGGDEFVVMLFGEDVATADDLFGRFSAFDLGCEHNGRWYHLSMSIGYASFPEQASSLNDAYSKADAALYAVKLTGKAGYRRYAPEVESQYRSQLGFTPRDIAENIPGAIMVHRVGNDGEILFANDELVKMFECDDLADFMEFTGGTFRNLVYEEDNERVREELMSQLGLEDVGSKNFSNFRIRTKTGRIRHVADNGRLVEIDDVGKVFYVLLVDRDEREFLSQ